MSFSGKSRSDRRKAQRDREGALPKYTVRESNRAKHVGLKVSLHEGLEIVVPRGFDHREIPGVLRRKQAWLEKAFRRANEQKAQRELLGPERELLGPGGLPHFISLAALGETWRIDYQPASASRLTLSEPHAGKLVLCGNMCGNTAEPVPCRALLLRWLQSKGRTALVPWLKQTSRELGLPYAKATVRGQKTRWGSCSPRKAISLNYKLLFLPPHLVRYLCVHELCHTKHLNHSPKYWALVGEKEPKYKVLEAELHEAGQYVPLWVDG